MLMCAEDMHQSATTLKTLTFMWMVFSLSSATKLEQTTPPAPQCIISFQAHSHVAPLDFDLGHFETRWLP